MNAAQIKARIATLEHMLGAMTSKAKLADKAALRAKIRALEVAL
jgi:hypothetical protein